MPHGRRRCAAAHDRGSWGNTPDSVHHALGRARGTCDVITRSTRACKPKEPQKQLGTLGGGNHFIEVCLDTEQTVWVMLHSGSRGIGNMIGQLFIELARKDMKKHFINLPDRISRTWSREPITSTTTSRR